MDTTYWNLFWTTGLPEAWMMSRGGALPKGSIPPGAGQELSGPLTSVQSRMSDNSPGGPETLY